LLERGGHDISDASDYVVSQSVVISGESGSGKTEAGKRVLRRLVSLAGPEQENPGAGELREAGTIGDNLDARLAGVGPILESFGNASTVCNHNSSRFGKFSKLHFRQNPRDRTTGGGKRWGLVGASVETFLLEQSRVVSHCAGERSFHVFYPLISGARQLRSMLFYGSWPFAAAGDLDSS
jgi:myosin heavy subunit